MQSALQLLDVFVEWLASENAINFHETHSLESSLSIIWISFLDSSIPHKESTPHDLLCLSTFRKFLAECVITNQRTERRSNELGCCILSKSVCSFTPFSFFVFEGIRFTISCVRF